MKRMLLAVIVCTQVLLTAFWAASDRQVIHEPQISKSELMGQFDPSTHPDFIALESKYTSKKNIYLRKEAYDSLKRMINAAKSDGIALTVISATRNFNYQKGIWQRKWNGENFKKYPGCDRARQILKYSSMPGSSRHHWGTDVDFNSVELSYFNNTQGRKVYEWLVLNAPTYGFHQTYTSKFGTGRKGFEEEKWHWSFLPLADHFLKEYNRQIKPEDFSGFDGAECAAEVRILEDYVNGIDSLLLTPGK